MIIGANDGFKDSQVAGCVERCRIYHLSKAEARDIVDRQIETITEHWDEVCDMAELPQAERNGFWKRQFLNDYALEGWISPLPTRPQ